MSDVGVTIREERGAGRGRFVGTVEGADGEAEITFSIVNDGLIIADHTGVPDSMRGMGVGQKLVAHMVEAARAGQFRIVPLCPFVNAQRQRHKEWADVFQV